MIILDLGCGDGFTPQKLSFPSDWQIVGLDINGAAVAKAHINFPDRVFICSAGEQLPFRACIFDRVICNVALPYMNIPKTLNEIYRVLVPGGVLLASLHTPSFTARGASQGATTEGRAVPLVVLANGVAFHFLGRNFGEAFQTERGIRIALDRANFVAVAFRSDSKRWFVEATRP